MRFSTTVSPSYQQLLYFIRRHRRRRVQLAELRHIASPPLTATPYLWLLTNQSDAPVDMWGYSRVICIWLNRSKQSSGTSQISRYRFINTLKQQFLIDNCDYVTHLNNFFCANAEMHNSSTWCQHYSGVFEPLQQKPLKNAPFLVCKL